MKKLLIILFVVLACKAFAQVDISPKFEGQNPGAFSQWISENIRYPQDALENGLEGRVTVSFTISVKGTVKDIKILRGGSPSMDAEAVRLISASPQWLPGIKNGVPTEVTYTIPVVFSNIDGSMEPAKFNGGNLKQFAHWVMSEIRLPKQVAKDKIGGLMKVSFIVNTRGELEQIQLLQGVHPLLDEEVIDIISASPLWMPAYKKGIPISVTCSLPLYFSWEQE